MFGRIACIGSCLFLGLGPPAHAGDGGRNSSGTGSMHGSTSATWPINSARPVDVGNGFTNRGPSGTASFGTGSAISRYGGTGMFRAENSFFRAPDRAFSVSPAAVQNPVVMPRQGGFAKISGPPQVREYSSDGLSHDSTSGQGLFRSTTPVSDAIRVYESAGVYHQTLKSQILSQRTPQNAFMTDVRAGWQDVVSFGHAVTATALRGVPGVPFHPLTIEKHGNQLFGATASPGERLRGAGGILWEAACPIAVNRLANSDQWLKVNSAGVTTGTINSASAGSWYTRWNGYPAMVGIRGPVKPIGRAIEAGQAVADGFHSLRSGWAGAEGGRAVTQGPPASRTGNVVGHPTSTLRLTPFYPGTGSFGTSAAAGSNGNVQPRPLNNSSPSASKLSHNIANYMRTGSINTGTLGYGGSAGRDTPSQVLPRSFCIPHFGTSPSYSSSRISLPEFHMPSMPSTTIRIGQ